ncbi:MAG: hypothetical protein FJZ98_05770 [Chloroflexi bacterium]|nr:hypothetical protein [Chloroflexota bacterium]
MPTTPVGLNEGLSSLNSYTFSIQTITSGPTPQDRSDTKFITSTDTVNESSMTRTESFFASADEPSGETSVTTNYRVGNVTCTINEDGESEAEVEDFSPAAREMLDILSSLWDVHITAENAIFVGSETISGINSNHYTFTVGGLGQSSGAEVTQSSGDYWTAVDGNYLVKYDVVLETRNAPEGSTDAEVLRSEVHFLLYDINSAMTIQLPAQCN